MVNILAHGIDGNEGFSQLYGQYCEFEDAFQKYCVESSPSQYAKDYYASVSIRKTEIQFENYIETLTPEQFEYHCQLWDEGFDTYLSTQKNNDQVRQHMIAAYGIPAEISEKIKASLERFRNEHDAS